MRKCVLIVLLLAMGLAGSQSCSRLGTEEEPERITVIREVPALPSATKGEPEEAGTEAEPPPAPGEIPAPEEVTLETKDGVTLGATYYAPPGGEEESPGLILVHEYGRSRRDWRRTAEQFQEAGFGVLTFDLRGHGDSRQKGEEKLSFKHMTEEEFNAATADLDAARAYLRKRARVDGTRIAVLGAELGANLALKWGAENPRVDTVIVASADRDYHGVKMEEANYQGPLLVLAGEGDPLGSAAARWLDMTSQAQKTVKMFPGGDRGEDLVRRDDVREYILQWLQERWQE